MYYVFHGDTMATGKREGSIFVLVHTLGQSLVIHFIVFPGFYSVYVVSVAGKKVCCLFPPLYQRQSSNLYYLSYISTLQYFCVKVKWGLLAILRM